MPSLAVGWVWKRPEDEGPEGDCFPNGFSYASKPLCTRHRVDCNVPLLMVPSPVAAAAAPLARLASLGCILLQDKVAMDIRGDAGGGYSDGGEFSPWKDIARKEYVAYLSKGRSAMLAIRPPYV
ncbi:hypothetical protein CLCR_07721 [Cladophialophora carrionii]|uniref:Uncharacterized protein n=1 Tax=Cladophialophora carrionii TaxID=86049 RepID=A0A1C1CN53_9EURO|nr:hypothetical protein CLCR_07721 [Cladophialophora carrionii]